MRNFFLLFISWFKKIPKIQFKRNNCTSKGQCTHFKERFNAEKTTLISASIPVISMFFFLSLVFLFSLRKSHKWLTRWWEIRRENWRKRERKRRVKWEEKLDGMRIKKFAPLTIKRVAFWYFINNLSPPSNRWGFFCIAYSWIFLYNDIEIYLKSCCFSKKEDLIWKKSHYTDRSIVGFLYVVWMFFKRSRRLLLLYQAWCCGSKGQRQ